MTRYVGAQPLQGALYHRLTAIIGSNYAGLGPQNVETSSYAPMVGKSFQKPLSASTATVSTVPQENIHR